MVGVNSGEVGEAVAVGTTGVGGGVAVWHPSRNIKIIVASRVLFIAKSPAHLLRLYSPLFSYRVHVLPKI
jgi:hypothetical protein